MTGPAGERSPKVRTYKQSCVPLWFKAKFGEDYAPIASTAEALPWFVAPAFAVSVRLESDDSVTVVAPFGLDDVFDMVIRPNPLRPLAKDWAKVTTEAKARWPELTVLNA